MLILSMYGTHIIFLEATSLNVYFNQLNRKILISDEVVATQPRFNAVGGRQR